MGAGALFCTRRVLVQERKNACADGRLSLSAARASAVGLRGVPVCGCTEGVGQSLLSQTGLPGQEERVCGTPRTLVPLALVSAGSCRPARRRRAGQITRHDVRARAALFWIKEGRTGSEERFAFATRSAATN